MHKFQHKNQGNMISLKIINPTITASGENELDKISDEDFKGIIINMLK